jgi:hypothetical protein
LYSAFVLFATEITPRYPRLWNKIFLDRVLI